MHFSSSQNESRGWTFWNSLYSWISLTCIDEKFHKMNWNNKSKDWGKPASKYIILKWSSCQNVFRDVTISWGIKDNHSRDFVVDILEAIDNSIASYKKKIGERMSKLLTVNKDPTIWNWESHFKMFRLLRLKDNKHTQTSYLMIGETIDTIEWNRTKILKWSSCHNVSCDVSISWDIADTCR